MTASGAWWEDIDGLLLGRYRIERVLGEGSMARVFAATDVKTSRPVAIKTPKIESFPADRVEEMLRRFHREFRSQIQEPIDGVVPVYDAVEVTDAAGVVRPLLVMQLLMGGSLGDKLGGHVGARAHRQTLDEVLKWLPRIADAVDTLHERKFLHRDVKPDNILFNRDGKALLADFGVIGVLDAPVGMGSSIGGSGFSLSPGSPGYQSPESIKSDPLERNAPASDQFSLGITVYEALSGKLPMYADSAATWYGALANWNPTSLATYCPELPPAVVAAVMKAIATRAHDRHLSCSQFADLVEQAMGDARRAARVEDVSVLKPTAADTANPGLPGSRRTLRIVVIPVVVLLALVFGAVWFSGKRMAPTPETAGPAPMLGPAPATSATAATTAAFPATTESANVDPGSDAQAVSAAPSFQMFKNKMEVGFRGAILRAGPNTHSEQVDQLEAGSLVDVADSVTGEEVSFTSVWYHVTTGDGTTGYVSASLLRLITQDVEFQPVEGSAVQAFVESLGCRTTEEHEITYAATDLDGQPPEELMIMDLDRGGCGSAGCSSVNVQVFDANRKPISDVYYCTDMKLGSTISQGMRDVVCSQYYLATETQYVLSWKGQRYELVTKVEDDGEVELETPLCQEDT